MRLKYTTLFTVNAVSVHYHIIWLHKRGVSSKPIRVCGTKFRLGNTGHVARFAVLLPSALYSLAVVQWEAYAAFGHVWWLW